MQKAAELEARKAALEKQEAEEALAREASTKALEDEIEALKNEKPATLEEAVEIQVRIRVQEERLVLMKELYEKESDIREAIHDLTLAQPAGAGAAAA